MIEEMLLNGRGLSSVRCGGKVVAGSGVTDNLDHDAFARHTQYSTVILASRCALPGTPYLLGMLCFVHSSVCHDRLDRRSEVLLIHSLDR